MEKLLEKMTAIDQRVQRLEYYQLLATGGGSISPATRSQARNLLLARPYQQTDQPSAVSRA